MSRKKVKKKSTNLPTKLVVALDPKVLAAFARKARKQNLDRSKLTRILVEAYIRSGRIV